MAKHFSPDGMRLTDCCGAFSTFSETTLVCKGCWEPVGMGQGDGSEYKVGLSRCDGCDEHLEGVSRFCVTDHNDRRSYAHYCPGCADLARVDWNGNTQDIQPAPHDVHPWIPEGGMVGRQWP